MDMSITLVVLIILLSIIILLCIKNIVKQNKEINKIKETKEEELKNLFKESWDKEEKDFNLRKAGLQIKEKEIENKVVQLNASLEEKQKHYDEVNKDLDLYKKEKIKEIDSTGAEYEQRKQLIISQAIDNYRKLKTNQFNDYLNKLYEEKNKTFDELSKVKIELAEECEKRAAINESIRRKKQMEEEGEFYRIQLNQEDKNDVEILRQMAPRLRHPEAINKVIWTGYYQKPLAELRKRLLPKGDISGIYKITRIKTKEIYIGQSSSIDRRFQEHVKTALGVGTLANSLFHKTLSKDGPENFFFEILEEVEKDKLRERESYYIDWFKSDTYGLNTIKGDQNK